MGTAAANKTGKRARVTNLAPDLNPTATSNVFQHLADNISEEAVIGSVFQKPEIFPSISDILQAADFSILLRGFIWHAFDELNAARVDIDIVSVAEKLEGSTCPLKGEALIRELSRMIEKAPNPNNAEVYARAVYDASTRMRIVNAAGELLTIATDKGKPIELVVDEVDQKVYAATNRKIEARTDTRAVMGAYFDKMQDMLDNGIAVPGVHLGFPELDDAIGSLYPGEVTVLAGGEGEGKTTWATSATRNTVKAGRRVAYFTLEMTQEEIIRNLTAMETGIFRSKLKAFKLSEQQFTLFTQAAAEIANWPLDIVDEFPTLTPLQLRRKARALMQTGALELIVVDGLWLMEANEPTRERWRDVFVIMRDLNQIARDFNVPLLVLHQYSAEIRNADHPTLYHLSESAGVRRNAQMIWGLHRGGSKYGDANPVTYLYYLKDRNGSTTGEKQPFFYNPDYSRYEEMPRGV